MPKGTIGGKRQEKLNIVINNENERITINSLKRGDTFKVDASDGGVYNLEVRSKMANGEWYVQGRKEGETGEFIGSLVSDRYYEEADTYTKSFLIPLSRTRNWRRK